MKFCYYTAIATMFLLVSETRCLSFSKMGARQRRAYLGRDPYISTVQSYQKVAPSTPVVTKEMYSNAKDKQAAENIRKLLSAVHHPSGQPAFEAVPEKIVRPNLRNQYVPTKPSSV